MQVVIGIDPGVHGAAACISKDRSCINVVRFSHGWKTVVSCLRTWCEKYAIACIYRERVGARRGDFTPQLATFMHNTGFIDGVLYMLGHTSVQVEPKTWQLEFGLGGKQGPPGCTQSQEYAARKRAHRNKVEELHLVNTLNLETADAILIAEYGYRQLFGDSHVEKTHIVNRVGTGVVRTELW